MELWQALTASPWFVPAALFLGAALWFRGVLAERDRRRRLKGQLGQTLGARLGGGLPAPVAILAGAGEGRGARQSADALVLTVTPGVKVLTVVIGAALLWLAWQPGAKMESWSAARDLSAPGLGGYLPPGPWAEVLTAVVALSILHQFLYEARVDRDRLVVEVLRIWRREYRWRDFRGIADAGSYEYRLDFGTARMRLPKYLVGMPGMLGFMGEVLARNRESDARARKA